MEKHQTMKRTERRHTQILGIKIESLTHPKTSKNNDGII